jgi:hypothetical protein
MKGAKTRVKIQNNFTDHSVVSSGLNQGNRLTLLLLNTDLDYGIRLLSIHVNLSVFYISGQTVGHADEIKITQRSTQTDGNT